MDVDFLKGCLGFSIVRERRDDNGDVHSWPLASYVAFEGQRNPGLAPQNTTVWPVQKFTWRDLTLRRKRDELGRRQPVHARYRIRAVGRYRKDLEPVEVVQEKKFGTKEVNTYEGKAIPLGYLTPAAHTNWIDGTPNGPPFTSTFTNGILSTQFIIHILTDDGAHKVMPGSLERRLKRRDDKLRRYLSGDVLELIRDFFDQQAGGRFHAALYELEDTELEDLLLEHAPRLDLILSDAGSTPADTGTNKPAVYDTRNEDARRKLRKAERAGTGMTLTNRMFNGSGHIGHNKFVVHVDDQGNADSVLTGSTNWTWSGVAGQSNNCIRIDDPTIADAFLRYWKALKDDTTWPTPKPLSAKADDAGQSDQLKSANRIPFHIDGQNGAFTEIWFSPNMPCKNQPPSGNNAEPPPDVERLFNLMTAAERAVFFLVFLPSKGGVHSIVEQAVQLGRGRSNFQVVGAVSDPLGMWGRIDPPKSPAKKQKATVPHMIQERGIRIARATALTDKDIGRKIGDFQMIERLAAEHAIIHDKILVLDPTNPKTCLVAFGSHNLGYKASYSNDENLVIVRGNQPLALAYATHVLDVYDHYRFRAAEAEANDARTSGRATSSDDEWAGFLKTTSAWQRTASRRLADYFAPPNS